MTHFEFLEFYKQNFNNDYSEKFKTLDLSNFVGLKSLSISSARKYPNTQDKLLHKFIDLSTKATKAEDIPYIIYAFVNKKRPEDGIRIGYTGNLPQIRVEGYQRDSKLKIYEGFPLYEDIKLKGIDNFKIIILDIQIGRKNALISESFFTISFNRDAKAKYGYDLSINLGYNKHVGDLTSLKGDEHYGYKKGIFFDDVNHLIESGYEMKDIAVIYGVQEKTIAERLRTWYSDQFGNTKIYNKVSTYLRTKKLIEYYSQGLMAHEIAKKFVKFDVSDKSTVFSIPKEAHDNLYVKGFLNTKHYSTMTINQWTLNNLKISSSMAYEKYFIKPIVISLLQLGYDAQEAVEVLEAMGITNPNKIGTPYSSQALVHLINERLWGVTMGKKWKELRKILMEPIIESLIRAGLTQSQVASKTRRSMSFVARFINNVWSFTSFKAARDFFHVPGGWGKFLGRHKADYYLYN